MGLEIIGGEAGVHISTGDERLSVGQDFSKTNLRIRHAVSKFGVSENVYVKLITLDFLEKYLF